ncbi:branched-chain-amino-acid transaminase [Mesorhizobium sp. Z1-4]|uniref:branched-chain-amino-acid transaminase n=1 Tax=Mesorhizobium sp. Z1-4 TaxID=2448478 RepID=UPI000FD763BD|nr:branched-chain-amino-acid transaminase [Mesorhizobium sp. Z1-4]
MAQQIIWFKGSLVPSEEARVNVLSPTAQFGLNVFEGIRAYRGSDGVLRIFRLNEHLKRLFQSCRMIGIESPYCSAEIASNIAAAIAANDYNDDIALRVTIFVDGTGTWHSLGPVDMFIAPVSRPRRDVNDDSGKSACVSSWRRISDQSMPPRIKTGANYINGRYGVLDAQRKGCDLPIFLDQHGRVAEGAGACLFLVRDGMLVTPTISDSILESITRDSLLKLAAAEGITADVRSIDRTELLLADEIFLCGSAAEITPLTTIDGLIVGSGRMGPLSRRMLELYYTAADGRDPRFVDWATAC